MVRKNMSFVFGMLLLRIDVTLGKIHEKVGVVSVAIVHNYFGFRISEEQSLVAVISGQEWCDFSSGKH